MVRPRDSSPGPRRDVALDQYRRRASVYDLELRLFEPLRRHAVDWLAPARGATVLDVGCGTGLSFALLQAHIGPGGRIVGIEQSPQMLERARQRVQQMGWRNVTLLQSAAEDAPLRGRADAALLHLTHDVMQNDVALARVRAHLRVGASVVASGLKWAPWWAAPLNLLVLPAALRSVSSLHGLERPWARLERQLGRLTVREEAGGTLYLARGQAPG